MAIDLAALKTELQTDPVGLGYVFDEANDASNADILNNANGDKPRTVDNNDIAASDFVAQTTFDAYDGLTAAETAYYDMLVSRERIAVTADTKANLAGIGGTSRWATADRPTMEPRVTALMQRTGSRAEELRDTLGVSLVTPSQVAQARQLP